MNKKNYNKSKAKNYFTKETGIPAVQLTGSSHCLIVDRKTVAASLKSGEKAGEKVSLPLALAAYYYLGNDIDDIKVTQTCGVDQCVHQHHLVAESKDKKKPFNPATDGWITS